MKVNFIIIFLFLFNSLLGQTCIDEKFVYAINFIKETEEIKTALRQAKVIKKKYRCSNLSFAIADSIHFINGSEFADTGISLFTSGKKYREKYSFLPFANSFSKLGYDDSECAVIFSKPIKNTLILEIVPVYQLKSVFNKPRLGVGFKILLLFEKGVIQSYHYRVIEYN